MREHLASLVEEFRRHAGETAVVAHRGNRRYATTYGELAGIAGRFAAELERRGVAPGERVALWGENSAEWIGVFFGCLLRGVIAVPLDAAGASEFAARVVKDVAPRLVVGDARLLAEIANGNPPFPPHQRSWRGPRPFRDEAAKGWGTRLEQGGTAQEGIPQGLKPIDPAKAYGTDKSVPLSKTEPAIPMMELRGIAQRLPAEPLFAVSDAVHRETPFQIVFTSGTTAEPRGVVHTHRNVLVSLQSIENEIDRYIKYERVFHPLRFLHSIPLSHVFGQFMGLWCPALLAAEVHFAEQLEPARVTELIRRERISVLVAVPRVLHMLRAHLVGRFPELETPPTAQTRAVNGAPVRDDGGSGVKGVLRKWWRYRRVHSALGWKFWAVISGGATLPAELEAFWSRLGFALIQGYGMTETAALVTLNHPFHIAPGTIGRALPGREVKISEEGEILVRGEMLSGATWAGGRMRAREGEWLATGDLAEKNAAGELRFLGRKGDVIVTGAGMNIHPADLEAALVAQAGVRGAVVVACEMAGGAEPVAVVLFSGGEEELRRAVAAANRGLAEVQQIRRVLRWPEIEFPYTSTGKLVRREVARWACEKLAGRRQSAAGSAAADRDELLELIAEVTGEAIAVDEIRDSAAVSQMRLGEDLHLDSLGRVQLQSALEQRFGVELEDDAVSKVEDVGELRALVEGTVLRSAFSVDRALPTDNRQRTTDNKERTTVNDHPVTREHSYPRWPWSWAVQAGRVAFIELVMRPVVWLLGAPRVVCEAAELPDAPVLVIANHVTAYDGALVLYALPAKLRRRVAAAMSGEMLMDMRRARNQPNAVANFFGPVTYWLLTALFNVFPLPRERGFRRSFAHAGEAMDRGYSVLIFPEGTRSRDGRLHAFRPGIGLLATESRVPIVPVAVVGLGELRASGGRWFRSGKIEVRIGRAIPAADEESDPAEFTARLEEAVRGLYSAPHQHSKISGSA
jgi:long-chain acyl-CoA synthetase